MVPRWYQAEAVAACWEHLCTRTDNPCIELPTGAGKSLVMAMLARDAVKRFDGRVFVLAHVKELLEQNARAIVSLDPTLDVGLYSAGLESRDRHNKIVVAGIQSVYKKADKLGKANLILIDECHLLKPDGEGMYATFLKDARTINPDLKLVGLTATPYRLSTGLICGPENLLNKICYSVSVRTLIAQGFLSSLTSKRGLNLDFSDLHMQRGEFVASEADALMCDVVRESVGEIRRYAPDRKSVLIFCQSRDHARKVQAELGQECGYVDGDSLDRNLTLRDFKAGRMKYLVNIGVLTTGFDHPGVDCVVLLRPTASPGLYYQMVGRGFRKADGKENCLVLDFGKNIERHGPVDLIEVRTKPKADSAGVTKTCPQCSEIIVAGYAVCPGCGYVFPARETGTHDAKASDANVVSEPETFAVKDIGYSVHTKKDNPESVTLRVDYYVGIAQPISEWVCIQHGGYARTKAEKWWKQRSREACPATASEAVQLAREGVIATPVEITVIQDGKWKRVANAVFGELPPTRAELMENDGDLFDLPVERDWSIKTPWTIRPKNGTHCGGREATICVKSGQAVVRCAKCDAYLYAAPREETGPIPDIEDKQDNDLFSGREAGDENEMAWDDTNGEFVEVPF